MCGIPFRFRNIRPSAVEVIESVKSLIRFLLPVFVTRFLSSRRRRFFNRQWGARGLFACFVGNKIVFYLVVFFIRCLSRLFVV